MLTATVSHAAMDMKPGLWEMSMKLIDGSGKEIDASQFAGKKASNKICYTKEMIENPGRNISNKADCETNIKTRTKTEFVSTYKCKDGMEGNMEFKLKDSKSFTMTTHTLIQDKKMGMKYYGKFLSSDCGDVKPLNL